MTPPVRATPRRLSLASARDFLELLARTNLLLALGMGAVTRVVQVMAGLPADPVPPVAVFLVFYAVYTLDRTADAETDAETHPERASFSGRHRRRMRASALAAYAAALALAAMRGWWSVAVALIPLVAVALYSFRFLPPAVARRVGFSRLKEVLVVKNLVVAATLASTAALLPVAAHGGVPRWEPVAAIGAFIFGRWWINTLVFDVRDLAGDRANGLRTLPVLLGRARTLRLLHIANALLAAATLVAPLAGAVPPLFAPLAASSAYAWAYLRAMQRGGDEHFLCDVVADGELLVLSVVVLLVAGLSG